MNAVGNSAIGSEMSMAYTGVRAQNLQSSQRTAEIQEDGEKSAPTAAPGSAAPRMDVVEISAAGRQAAVAAAGGAEEDASIADLLAAVEDEEETADASSVLDALLTDSGSISTTELYTASESELNSLVADGTITRAELEKELARRGGGAAAQSVEE